MSLATSLITTGERILDIVMPVEEVPVRHGRHAASRQRRHLVAVHEIRLATSVKHTCEMLDNKVVRAAQIACDGGVLVRVRLTREFWCELNKVACFVTKCKTPCDPGNHNSELRDLLPSLSEQAARSHGCRLVYDGLNAVLYVIPD
jgi:hypothetical protein